MNLLDRDCPLPAALRHRPLQRLRPGRPVDRIAYLVRACRGKRVIDLGCWDETALIKKGTPFWLHEAIARSAKAVLGIDCSRLIPPEGLRPFPNSLIIRADVYEMDRFAPPGDWEVIVAGELIEHLTDVLSFFRYLRSKYAGCLLLATTPNASAAHSILLALFSRESAHPDHLQIYSWKTLDNLSRKAEFKSWRILPYHVRFTEMALRRRAEGALDVRLAETLIHGLETLFPLLSGGWILQAVI